MIESSDAGDRAWKIEERLSDKVTKYRGTEFPLVLFVFLGDHNLLSLDSVGEAALGQYWFENEVLLSDLLASQAGGMLEPGCSCVSWWDRLILARICQRLLPAIGSTRWTGESRANAWPASQYLTGLPGTNSPFELLACSPKSNGSTAGRTNGHGGIYLEMWLD